MFAPEGRSLIAGSLVISALFFAAGGWLGGVFLYVFIGIGVLPAAFTLYFFRDPKRTPPPNPDGLLLLAPADGKVVVLQDIPYEPLYLKGPAKQISIFLSPLNVHVNRIPANGTIEFDQYVPGDYLVAWHPKASEKNERSQLGLRHPNGTRILFKQIAGAVARRIVYYPKVGDTYKAGDRFGIVKFGSRMDILVPPDTQISLKMGDRVTAGETVMGRLKGQGDRPEPADLVLPTAHSH